MLEFYQNKKLIYLPTYLRKGLTAPFSLFYQKTCIFLFHAVFPLNESKILGYTRLRQQSILFQIQMYVLLRMHYDHSCSTEYVCTTDRPFKSRTLTRITASDAASIFDEQPTELLSQQHAVHLRLLETMRLNTNTTYVFCIFRTSNIKFQCITS